MVLLILTVLMGGIIVADTVISNSPKERSKIAEAEQLGKDRANAKIAEIRKVAQDRAKYWANTDKPFNKWKN